MAVKREPAASQSQRVRPIQLSPELAAKCDAPDQFNPFEKLLRAVICSEGRYRQRRIAPEKEEDAGEEDFLKSP